MAKKAAKPKPAAKGDEVVIELKGDAKYGNRFGAEGDPIATVKLEEGVSLNYVIDAFRNGLAQERNEEDDARREKDQELAEKEALAARDPNRPVPRVEVPPSPSRQTHSTRRGNK